jgi:hypothetical protein
MSRKWTKGVSFSISSPSNRAVWPVLIFLATCSALISLSHAQPSAVEPQAGNVTTPSAPTNDTAPEAPNNSRSTLIKSVGAAAICVEVLLSGFVPQLLLRVGPRWLGLANVCLRHYGTSFPSHQYAFECRGRNVNFLTRPNRI